MNHRRWNSTNSQSQQFDRISIACSQKFRKCIAKILEFTHNRESAFVVSNFSSKTYIIFYFFLIISASRALFCLVFHRIFQILTKHWQRRKIIYLVNVLRNCYHRYRCNNRINSIRKWSSIYKASSNLLFSFFLFFHRRHRKFRWHDCL